MEDYSEFVPGAATQQRDRPMRPFFGTVRERNHWPGLWVSGLAASGAEELSVGAALAALTAMDVDVEGR
jgi:hypothetical protein